MEPFWQSSFGLAVLSCFLWALVSAVLPCVNAEVLVVSLPAIAGSRGELATLLVVATMGQMAGKCIVYYVARRGAMVSSGRISHAVQRWRARALASPHRLVTLVLASSLVGIPPFFVMSAVAGALKVKLGSFLVAGTCGRLVRFTALALASKTILQLFGY